MKLLSLHCIGCLISNEFDDVLGFVVAANVGIFWSLSLCLLL